VVAEQFGTLRALFGDRIDLGIGRAPGTDPVTASALRRSEDALGAEDFPQQLLDLLGFFTGGFGPNDPLAGIRAVPGLGDQPQVWLLGSSGYSAQVAAALGLPFAFAHHFAGEHTEEAQALYRARFQPSATLEATAGIPWCSATQKRSKPRDSATWARRMLPAMASALLAPASRVARSSTLRGTLRSSVMTRTTEKRDGCSHPAPLARHRIAPRPAARSLTRRSFELARQSLELARRA
jgi:luciferase family oxidoreductase group 1